MTWFVLLKTEAFRATEYAAMLYTWKAGFFGGVGVGFVVVVVVVVFSCSVLFEMIKVYSD